MAKYCGNCGAELADNAKVCGQCGTPFERVPGSRTANNKNPEKQAKAKKMVKLGLVAAALIIVAVFAVNSASYFAGSDVLLEKVMNAYVKYDIEVLVDVYSDAYHYNSYYSDEFTAEDYFEYVLGRHRDYFESCLGSNYMLSYEVIEVNLLSEKDKAGMLETIEKNCPGFDITTISQIKVAEITVTASKGKSSESMEIYVNMAKQNGKWKLVSIV